MSDNMDNMTRFDADLSKETSQKSHSKAWIKGVIALLISYFIPVLVSASIFLGPIITPDNQLLGRGIGELAVGLTVVLVVALLGGGKWLRLSAKGLGNALRFSWPFLACDVVLAILAIIRLLQNGEIIENALPVLLEVFVLCIGIAVFEEANFRGLMLNGLLAPLGKSRGLVLTCVIISALWFGRVHVGTIDLQDTTAVILAALKILQAGCFGVIMSTSVLRTRELGGAFFVHLIHDFMLMAVTVLAGGQAKANYADSSAGLAGFIAYAILLAVILPPTIGAIRSILRNRGEDHGAFM